MIKPIFIISIPRSGSTLLNKLLASHSKIASHAEPWIMLPITYLTKSDGINAIYNHNASSRAINDIARALDENNSPWNIHIRNFVLRIYKDLAKNGEQKDVVYFVDKTPRYHLIIDSLYKTFPDAKFIILVRNPLSCLSSGIETWGKGQLRLHGMYIDLYKGIENLAYAIKMLGNQKWVVKFESLINSPESVMEQIFHFLDLPVEPVYDKFKDCEIKGSMGDPIGVKKYKSMLSKEPLNKYINVLGTWYRKRYALNYIKMINTESLNCIGYPKKVLMEEIMHMPSKAKGLFSDFFIHVVDNVWRLLDVGYFRDRIKLAKITNKMYIQN